MLKALRAFIKRINSIKDYDWRHVPPPNWACKRSGRDYW
jgi:hypothetical protein